MGAKGELYVEAGIGRARGVVVLERYDADDEGSCGCWGVLEPLVGGPVPLGLLEE